MIKKRSDPPAAAPADTLTLAQLVPDPRNHRVRTPRGQAMLAASFREVGPARSIVIDEDDIVRAGNGALQAAAAAGITKLKIVDADGDTLVAVRRRGWTPEQKRAASIYDNRTAELAEWSGDQVLSDVAAGLDLRPFWTPEEEAALLSAASAEDVLRMAADKPDEPAAAVTTGDFQTFSCPLTVEQERTVRAALRRARAVYQVTTAGDALALALAAWASQQGAAVGQDS